MKKANFNCVVKLENIDRLLRENNISADSKLTTHHKMVNIGIKIRKCMMTANNKTIKLGDANTINIGLSIHSNQEIV